MNLNRYSSLRYSRRKYTRYKQNIEKIFYYTICKIIILKCWFTSIFITDSGTNDNTRAVEDGIDNKGFDSTNDKAILGSEKVEVTEKAGKIIFEYISQIRLFYEKNCA